MFPERLSKECAVMLTYCCSYGESAGRLEILIVPVNQRSVHHCPSIRTRHHLDVGLQIRACKPCNLRDARQLSGCTGQFGVHVLTTLAERVMLLNKPANGAETKAQSKFYVIRAVTSTIVYRSLI